MMIIIIYNPQIRPESLDGAAEDGHKWKTLNILSREVRESQGIGVVSNNCVDRVLLSILYMSKPSCRPMFKPPSLGPP